MRRLGPVPLTLGVGADAAAAGAEPKGPSTLLEVTGGKRAELLRRFPETSSGGEALFRAHPLSGRGAS